jgi:hypothetical protein
MRGRGTPSHQCPVPKKRAFQKQRKGRGETFYLRALNVKQGSHRQLQDFSQRRFCSVARQHEERRLLGHRNRQREAGVERPGPSHDHERSWVQG